MLLASAEKKGAALELKTTTDLLFEVDNDFCSLEKPGFVLFWDKDIYLAQRLENKGFQVYNSARAIEVCDNKILTAIALEQAGVRTPKTVVLLRPMRVLAIITVCFWRKQSRYWVILWW